jgi:hypothetical protein
MKHLLKSVGILATVCGVAAGLAPVAAHHSAAMFEKTKTLTIKGTVVEFRWVNPHVSISINGVTKDGEPAATWILESTSPGNLVRSGGWRREAIKLGEPVEVLFNPLRDSEKKGGSLRTLKLISTGEVFSGGFREQEQPGLD